MDATQILYVVLGLLAFGWIQELVVETLNLKNVSPDIPDEFAGIYDADKYAKSQAYLTERTRFGLFSTTVSTLALAAFIWFGGFGWVDAQVSALVEQPILRGLLFAGALVFLSTLLGLPFSIYSTFVIEEKYGFNKTTAVTFITDFIKNMLIGAVIGSIIFSIIIWFFMQFDLAWLYAWIAITVISLFLLYIYPVTIMPIFNKFTPLEAGELQNEIRTYAEKQGFEIQGIFSVDGSKRSSKANAYFTGFGNTRRIGLFDTLIENHSVKELVSVLAHEIGHCKLHHIKKMLVIGILSTGAMFFIMSFFLNTPALYEAFGIQYDIGKIYAGIVFFGFLYSPISSLLSLVNLHFTRKHEFEADAYAATTTGESEPMVEALKKLTVDNLGNLNPHPLKVFLEYSHPPVLRRIEALKRLKV